MPEERYEVPRDTWNQRMYGGRRAGKTHAAWQAAQQKEWDLLELQEALMPILALEHTIMDGCYLRPSGIMLPMGLGHRGETMLGHDVILGDRIALLYQPPS